MSTIDRGILAAAGAALVLALAAGWLLVAPEGATEERALAFPSSSASTGALASAPAPEPSPTGEIVVDVEGGVLHPGIQRLPAGSRVADAMAAAGGYAPSADLIAAAEELNLAKPLTDGEQVFVPMLGAEPATAGGEEPAPDGSDGATVADGGLVDLNTATPEELEALPGIGPVTVQKIVAARQERPFASLDEAQERGVLDRGQLEQIRDLATAG